MARYRMDDGTVLDTANATAHWDEDTYWDGRNRISVATGSQWDHETLYRSRKGRYYVEHDSQWQGKASYCTWIGMHEAAAWLLANNRELPEDLEAVAEEVSE